MSVAKMSLQMNKWKNTKDNIWNKEISLKKVIPIDEKIRESCLRWFDYVQRALNILVIKSEFTQVEGTKKR